MCLKFFTSFADKIKNNTSPLCSAYLFLKLNRVGPVDNRPSTEKLQHLLKQKKNK